MAKTRIALNHTQLKALLRSDEVLADLKRRGEAIARAAGDGMEVQAWRGKNRVRVTVRTRTAAARRAERDNKALTRALDAGR
jgi:hypothetical protein